MSRAGVQVVASHKKIMTTTTVAAAAPSTVTRLLGSRSGRNSGFGGSGSGTSSNNNRTLKESRLRQRSSTSQNGHVQCILWSLGWAVVLVLLGPYYIVLRHSHAVTFATKNSTSTSTTTAWWIEDAMSSWRLESVSIRTNLSNGGPMNNANHQDTEIPAETKRNETRPRPSSPDYHVVFSTSCDHQQHWESFVFFFHAMRIRQPGTVTRIASGCNEKQAHELQAFHDSYIEPMAIRPLQRFAMHLTPSYGSSVRLVEGRYPYKYFNKPFGLRHWMEHGLHLSWRHGTDNATLSESKSNLTTADIVKDRASIASPHEHHEQLRHQALLDSIVILMDPDMVLLKPISHDFGNAQEHLWASGGDPSHTVVSHGHPIAQQDGYLSNEWMGLNFTYITDGLLRDDATTPRPPASADGPLYWNSGPPYLATVADMYRLASVWTETAPRVLDVYPELFAEMYGLIIAAVVLELPFALTKSIVISTTEAYDREGWAFVDGLPDQDICNVAVAATVQNSSQTGGPILPTGLHYCSIYILGKVCTTCVDESVPRNYKLCVSLLLRVPNRAFFLFFHQRQCLASIESRKTL
jgi:hypothetical protein